MRYVTFVLIPGEDGLHPLDQALADDPSIARETIHDISLLNDDTAITIYQLTGDVDAIERLLDDHPDTLATNVTRTRESVHAYVHFEPNETIRRLLEIPREYELIVDTPMAFTARGGLELTVIGDEEMVRRAIPEIPRTLRPKLTRTGDYEPDDERLFSLLTTRQQQILQTAVQHDYYSEPRGTTHEELAAALDCSPATVGEHLRRIEATLLTSITP